MRRLIVTLQIFTIGLAFLAQGGLLSALIVSTKFGQASSSHIGRALKIHPKTAFPSRSYRLYLAVVEEEDTVESSTIVSSPVPAYLSDLTIVPPHVSRPLLAQYPGQNTSLARLVSDTQLRC